MLFLFGFLIFIAAVYGLMIGSALLKLRKLRWTQRKFYTPVSDGTVDPMARRLLQSTGQALQALGFEPYHWYQLQDPLTQEGWAGYHQVFYHPAYHSYAQVGLHPLPESGQGVTVEFLNFYDHAPVCYTSNGTRHLVGLTIAGYDWEDPCVPSLDQHWSHHRERARRNLAQPRDLSAAGFADRGNRFIDQYQKALCEHGELKETQPGQYRLTWRGCWRGIRRVQVATRQMHALRQAQDTPDAPDLSTEADVLAHRRQDAILQESGRGALGKTVLLLASVVLFMASFGYRMDLEALLILLGVLAFHELGHVAAMALFGYRDLQILFIPFLGAVATGRKQHCPPWQSAVIYLAGPLPGLLLAAVLWQTGFGGSAEWMHLLIVMLLVINFFNLLPIQPLDGGQLANVLLFQRWPRLQILFYGLSVLMFLTLAWFMDEPLLAGLGFLLGFGLLHQYREAKMLALLRQEHPNLRDAPRPDQLYTVYNAIRQLGLPWKFGTRQQATRNILDRLGHPLPKLWESGLGLTLYLAILLGTPATILAAVDYPLGALLAGVGYEEPDWPSQLAAAETPEQQLDVLTRATHASYYSELGDEALNYNHQAIDLLNRQGQADSPEMADARLLRAMILMDYADLDTDRLAGMVTQNLDQAIRILQQRAPGETGASRLADAYEQKARVAELLDTPQVALRHWQTAAEHRQRLGWDQAWPMSENLNNQARLYLELGDTADAERCYLERLAWSDRIDAEDNLYFKEQALHTLAGFYLDHQHYHQALELIANHPYPNDSDYRYFETELTEMAGWAHYKLGQWADANARFDSAIALIEKRQLDYPQAPLGYQKADNITRLMLVHQTRQQENGSRQDSVTIQTGLDRLLAELDRSGRTVAEYRKHLVCECDRQSGGFRLEQSKRLHALINHALPATEQAM
ncbi:MAG: hypothetical protein R3276_06410 [Marinobacter sp.]|nr:hypothetical protein [Marinobacter sp.]